MLEWTRGLIGLLVVVLAAGCGDDGDGGAIADAAPDTTPDVTADTKEDATPDAAEDAGPDVEDVGVPTPAVHEHVDNPAVASASAPFTVDEPTQYRTTERLPVLDVRVLSFVGGRLYAGTSGGLFVYAPESDAFEAVETSIGEVLDLADALDGAGRLAVLSEAAVSWLSVDGGAFTTVEIDATGYHAVAVHQDTTWIAGEAGLAEVTDEGVEPHPGHAQSYRDVAVDVAGAVWLAHDGGVLRWLPPGPDDSLGQGQELLPDPDVRSLTPAPDGEHVWAGTATGIARLGSNPWSVVPTPGARQLPAGDVGAVHALADGRILVGHGVAASLLELADDGADTPFVRVDHYAGLRWLPTMEVTDVVADADGALWLATPAGITRIDWVERTLAGKAEVLETLQEEHFWRMDGFVPSDIRSDDAWSPTSWNTYDKDNDGLWTQMQIGAWCYAYATTGDERYYDKARKALDTMLLQIRVPAKTFEEAGLPTGFVTRSLVRSDEGGTYTNKADQPNWHAETYEGADYYWKDDTSSDEYAGHYYGYPLFYDLCAKTEAERQEIADAAALAMDYIIDGGFELIDLDGERTLHGQWSPEHMSVAYVHGGVEGCVDALTEEYGLGEAIERCGESWFGGGWLNSVEILGHLLATWHMTGEPRFYEAYEALVTEHLYDESATPHDETVTIVEPQHANHSDHELAMLAYQTLIRYEPNEERRQRWIDGLLFLYEHEEEERNPLWTAYVAIAAGWDAVEMQAGPALESLRLMPQDRRALRMDNTHRKDSVVWPDDRHGDPQFARVFPYDEIRTIWWNGNLHNMQDGGDGTEISGPTAYLLPYWALRYSGLLSE
ncbi:MAG: hypothetical protein ACQEXJ_07285 [Myxococcota bacterium]